MTNKEVDKKIAQAFSAAVPDSFDAILSKCEKTPKKDNIRVVIRRIISIAAAVAIIFTAGAVGYGLAGIDRVDSVISFDVNPSIELEINKKERIISATARNKDAEAVLKGMDLTGSNLSVAVNAIIGSMLKNGYIDELSNSILVTVDNADVKKGAKLEERLSKEISELMKTDGFEGAVISQTLKREEKEDNKAQEHGITKGKAQLIRQIIKADSRYTFEALAPLTINELNLIASSKKEVAQEVKTSGSASQKKYIGEDEAKKKALKHAEVKKADLLYFEYELDYGDGVMLYELEFGTASCDYDYAINATNGKVISSKVALKTSSGEDGAEIQNEPQADNNSSVDTEQSYESDVNSSEMIDSEEETADKKPESGNTSSGDNSNTSQNESPADNNSSDNTEHSYESDVNSGNAIEPEKENADDKPVSSNASSGDNHIGEAMAKKSALQKADALETDISDYKCQLKDEDGKAYYEIEFYVGTVEYSFKVDANTGVLMSAEAEVEDDKPVNNISSNDNYIDEATAKAAALTNAGVLETEIYAYSCKLESDNGVACYNIYFVVKSTQYSYKIDAATGEVISAQKEEDDEYVTNANTSSSASGVESSYESKTEITNSTKDN